MIERELILTQSVKEGPGAGGLVAAHMAQLVSVLSTNTEMQILDLEHYINTINLL